MIKYILLLVTISQISLSIRLKGDSNSKKKALLVFTDGSEDIETVTAIDILRRAKIDLTVARVMSEDQCTEGDTSIAKLMQKSRL